MAVERHRELFDPSTALGRACAEVDWAASAVGPPDTWSESLRTTFALMTASRFSMWMAWGPELTFFCNDAYRQDTLGRKFPWALGRPASEVWAEIWPDIGPLIDTVVNQGASTWDEGMQLFLERSGFSEETYHTFSYSPLVDDDGRVAGMFCVVSEDTGRVLSQRRIGALRDLASGLSSAYTEAEVFAAAEVELAKDPYDLPFVIGYLADDHDTATLAFAAGIAPGHPAAPLTFDIADVGGGSPWAEYWPEPGALRRTDDLGARFTDLPTGAWTERPVQALLAGLSRGGDGGLAGAVVVGMNPHRPLDADYEDFVTLVADQLAAAITRARGFEAERRRAEQMAELDRAKTTFFTNVSHELRTPLTLLLGPAEDALNDTQSLDRIQRRRFEVIQRNGERLLKLVNTLLDFSRLESGQTRPRFERVELDRLTAELASMFESAFGSAGLEFTVECSPLDVEFYVDREMWAKIVLNLVSNALKATFTGGVTVALIRTADGAELRVSDTGVGVEAAELTHLFERFHRVAGAQLRTHEGSGIGLALVAELASFHGGEVSVESAVGVGSTFTVTIPAGVAHLDSEDIVVSSSTGAMSKFGAGYLAEAMRWFDDEVGSGADGTPSSVDPDGRRYRILVVDDNADMRLYVQDLLAHEYAVTTASDGSIALAQARSAPPDLVLTDVMMPVLDGFGLLRELRADPITQHIPVVMLSARSGNESAVEGLEAGADDYLVKPFSQRELLARVRSNLELDRVRRVADDLARNREMLAHAEDLAQVGSFEYDALTGELTGTTQFFRLIELEAQGAVLDGLASAVHADDRDRVVSALRGGVDFGDDVDLEFAFGDDGARTLWLRGVAHTIPGGSTRSLRGSVQDITARRAAQQALAAVAAAREVAAREHEIAYELQQSLLPARTFDADHLDIATYYQAGVEGTQVGGDWYDVIELDAGRTALVLGDVMGRGIQAAAVMGQLRATVRAYARLELSPDALMHLLDDAVREIRQDMIVTCIYAVYEPMGQTLTYSTAGHLPPLLLVPGERPRRLTQGGPPLGAGRAWGPPETVALPTGSLLALYTDGLVERRGADIDEGVDRLAELLQTAPDALDALPRYFVDTLLPEGQDDDVAVLVARVSDRAGSDRVFATDVPHDIAKVSEIRDAVATQLGRWAISETQIDDVRLVVSELVTNAMVHGRPPLELRMRKGGGRLFIEVYDSAVTSPQLRHAAPTDNHGRGLLIVSLIAQRWGTRPTPSGKAVWCQLAVT